MFKYNLYPRNPDGEDNNSAADDGASLFEEFSDSLTELKMGNKLYQRWVVRISRLEHANDLSQNDVKAIYGPSSSFIMF